MAKFECKGCGYIFDEQQAGIKFSEIMECPICAGPREEFEQKEEEKKETKDEKKDDAGYVIEKRQEFWLEEKDKKPEKEPDRSNIETYYDGEGVIPVKTPEQLEKEAKEKEEAERPKLDPIEVTGTNIVERGDRSSDGSDSEVVVVDEATSDVDTGDDEKKEETEAGEEKAEEKSEETEAGEEVSEKTEDNAEDDFFFEEVESSEPLETEEIPAAVSAGIHEEGDFFTGFNNSPTFGDAVRTEEFIFDDEEPVGEVVELDDEVEETAEEAAEAVEETVEETAEEVAKTAEAAEEEKAEEAAETEASEEEKAEEATEETTEEVAEETTEAAEEEKTEEAAETETAEEEKAEETTEETTEEVAEETTEAAEEKAEEAAETEVSEEEKAEETTEEAAEEAVEEVAEAAEEKAEEAAETETSEEEKTEESIEETAEEVAEKTAEAAEEKAEEAVETEAVEEEKVEETAVETAEEVAEETAGAVEEKAEEAAETEVSEEEKAEETTEETVEAVAETAEEAIAAAAAAVVAEEVAEAIGDSPKEADEEAEAEEAGEEVLSDSKDFILVDDEEEEKAGTEIAEDKKYHLLTDEQVKSLFEQYGIGPASNGLEGIILLPAQLDPMPLGRDEEIDTESVIGKFSAQPVFMNQPFACSESFLWGEYIPGEDDEADYSEASLILVKGKNSHIPTVSGKKQLRKEVALAKEKSGGKPIGLSLMIGRIEQDLAVCVNADVDFVVLNDVSSGMLPYALRRAINYLSRVNSGIDVIVSIEDVNNAQEIAKLLALGADYILLKREYSETTTRRLTAELREIARNTGHKDVHGLNMYDICTIDRDLAANTDISHF